MMHILHIQHIVHILNMYFPGFKLSDDEEMPEDMRHNLPPQDTQAPQNRNNGYIPSAFPYKTLPTMSIG
jgi:hypothetical protein